MKNTEAVLTLTPVDVTDENSHPGGQRRSGAATEFRAGHLYSAAEAAQVLGFRRRNTIYEIPERDLPRTRVGPRRGRTMFRGEDLLAYLTAGRNTS